MKIRIDRLKLAFDLPEVDPAHLEDLVLFEAIVKFDDGTVKASLPKFTRSEAVTAAQRLVKDWKPKDTLPPAYQQSPKEAAELWAVGSEVESEEVLGEPWP